MSAIIEKLNAPANRIEGFVEAVEGTTLYGWAWDRLHPDERLTIEVELAGGPVTTQADRPRPDLAANGIGDGAHAFTMEVPDGMQPEVVAISPSTGARVVLQQPAKPDSAAEAAALLRGAASALQRIGQMQESLKRQQDGMEVFLVRAEALMTEITRRLDEPPPPPPPPARGVIARLVDTWFK
ncbi:MAG: hypothetical protein ACM33T_16525 [Solirubrobacterales bacterium]